MPENHWLRTIAYLNGRPEEAPPEVTLDHAARELDAWFRSHPGQTACKLLAICQVSIILTTSSEAVAGHLPSYFLTDEGWRGSSVCSVDGWVTKPPDSVEFESANVDEIAATLINEDHLQGDALVSAIIRTLDLVASDFAHRKPNGPRYFKLT